MGFGGQGRSEMFLKKSISVFSLHSSLAILRVPSALLVWDRSSSEYETAETQ